MPNLTSLQKEQVLVSLGYSKDIGELVRVALDEDFYQTSIDRIVVILTDLAEIDTTLKTSRIDSQALVVDTLKVDFAKQIKILKSEGTTLLNELSQITQISIKYNKYLTSVNRNCITAYW